MSRHDASVSRLEALLGPSSGWGGFSAAATFRPEGSLQQPDKPSGFEIDAAQPFQRHDVIGKGGMGVVYRATQASLCRSVALKTMRDRGRDEGTGSWGSADFQAEALTVGRLQHPNIVPVYEFGWRDGAPFFAMKLVGGRSWEDILGDIEGAEQRFHLETLLQVCNAVAFAHSRGITHNDLKPANVMVGQFGEVLLMDWGLATEISDPPGGGLRHRTQVTGMCGTPSYMPPELANGDGQAIGPWTDVYLLGGILQRILSGRPPRPSHHFLDVMLDAVVGQVAPLPSHAPEELCSIARQALSPEPEKRQQSVLELQAQLRLYLKHEQSLRIGFLAGQQLNQLAQGSRGQLLDETERTRMYDGLGGAVAGFGQALQLWPDNPNAQQGEVRARRAYAQCALEQGDFGLAELQIAHLEGNAAQDLAAAIHAERVRVQAERQMRRRLKRGLFAVVVVALLGLSIAFFEVWKARAFSEAKGQAAVDALRELTREIQPQIAFGHGETEAVAQRLADIALRGWEQLRDTDVAASRISFGTAQAMYSMASLQMHREGNLTEARQQLEAARAILEADLADDPQHASWYSLTDVLLALGRLAQRQGRTDDAQALYEHVLQVCEQQQAHAHPVHRANANDRSRSAYSHLGNLLLDQGALDEAEPLLRSCLQLSQQLLGAQPDSQDAMRDVARAQSALAELLWLRQQVAEAAELHADALTLFYRLQELRPSSLCAQDLAKSASRNGDMQAAQGDLLAAQESFGESHDIFAQLVLRNPGNFELQYLLATSVRKLAELAKERQLAAEAVELFSEACRQLAQLCEFDSSAVSLRREYGSCLAMRATARMLTFDLAAAERDAREGLEILDATNAAQSDDLRAQRRVADALQALTEVLLGAGRPEQARAFAERNLVLSEQMAENVGGSRVLSDAAQAALRLAEIESELGNFERSWPLLQRARAWRRAVHERNPLEPIAASELVTTLVRGAELRTQAEDGLQAASWYAEALLVAGALVEKLPQNRRALRLLAGAADAGGMAFARQGDFEQSRAAFASLQASLECLVILESHLPELRRDLAISFERQARVAERLGEVALMVELLEKGCAALEAGLEAFPDEVFLQDELTNFWGNLELARSALREQQLIAGERPPENPSEQLVLAVALFDAQRWEEAYPHFEAGLRGGREPARWADPLLAAITAAGLAEQSGELAQREHAWLWLAMGLEGAAGLVPELDAGQKAELRAWLEQLRDAEPRLASLREDPTFAALFAAVIERLEPEPD